MLQGRHDDTALHVGSASSHLPGRHPDPDLGTGDKRQEVMRGCGGTDAPAAGAARVWVEVRGRIHTSSQTTTVGPSHCAKARLVSRLPPATHAYK